MYYRHEPIIPCFFLKIVGVLCNGERCEVSKIHTRRDEGVVLNCQVANQVPVLIHHHPEWYICYMWLFKGEDSVKNRVDERVPLFGYNRAASKVWWGEIGEDKTCYLGHREWEHHWVDGVKMLGQVVIRILNVKSIGVCCSTLLWAIRLMIVNECWRGWVIVWTCEEDEDSYI